MLWRILQYGTAFGARQQFGITAMAPETLGPYQWQNAYAVWGSYISCFGACVAPTREKQDHSIHAYRGRLPGVEREMFLEVMRWKVYYDDGTTFSSDDGSAEKAPLDGVQAVVQYHPNGRNEVLEGHDYYWWTGDCWAYGRVNDLERWLRAMCPGVKFGRFTRTAIHQRIMGDLYGSS